MMCYICKNKSWPRLFYQSNIGRTELLMYRTTKAVYLILLKTLYCKNDPHLLKPLCTAHFKTPGCHKEAPPPSLSLLLRSAFSDAVLSAHAARERLAFTNWVKSPSLSYRLRYRLSLLLLVILSAGWISITMPGVIVVLALESWGEWKSLDLW